TEISGILNQLAPHTYNKGYEVRVLMPRYGVINERRHRLHEVVRLSGMNIIVDDDDFPLIIKVASLPGSRMQVYFLDNEEFFKRKFIFEDGDDAPFEDNADRMVFFCKGVMETVKKFGWAPDIIHCSGWMTSLIPMYHKKIYSSDPIFQDATMIYSAHKESYEETFNQDFLVKAMINNLTEEDLAPYHDGDRITLHEGAIKHADAIIKGSESYDGGVQAALDSAEVPSIAHNNEEFLVEYLDFYQSFLQE
ncbi:MAG: glycogen/starch synthase, partial [Bacteroidota bacterium]